MNFLSSLAVSFAVSIDLNFGALCVKYDINSNFVQQSRADLDVQL